MTENLNIKNNVLICGHIDLSIDSFNKYYEPAIKSLLLSHHTFFVGGAKGVDTFAQNYLSTTNNNVIVCDKGDQNNNLYPFKYQHKNGFQSYIDRDGYMTDNIGHIIVFLRKHYMSLGSGSFSNVVRLMTDRSTADKFMKHARDSKYDETMQLNEYYDNVIDTFEETTSDIKSKLKQETRNILIIE